MSEDHRNDLSGSSDAALQARDIGSVHFGEARHPIPPNQAPGADRKFTNRVDDIDRMEELARDVIRSGRGAIALLMGESGIGKSVTLAEVSARVSDSFESGVLYRDLAKWRDREGNLDISGVLRGLLSDLHVHDVDADADVRTLMGLLRGASAGKKTLLLLDDATGDTELGLFALGSGPNLTVAACAEGFAGATDQVVRGAEALTLRALADEDSLRLFRSFRRVDRILADRAEYASAVQLMRLCGGLPSAIRMAAGHVERQNLSVTALLEAVRSRQRSTVPPLKGVDAVIDVALSGLSEDDRGLLEVFATYPGRSVPDELGYEKAGEKAPEMIGRLADASLLHPATGAGRGVIELVRVRVQEGATERWEFNAEAVLRFFTVTHHRADRASSGERYRLADSLDSAELTIAPADHRLPFTTPREAADWQDQNLEQVLDLTQMADTIGNPVAVLVLADAVWPICHSRARWETATRIYGFALRVARRTGHGSAIVRCACYGARAHMELGQEEQAAELVAEAARTARGLDQAVVLETHGLLSSRFPDLPAIEGIAWLEEVAEDSLSASLEIHRELGRPRGTALQTYQLGNRTLTRDDPSQAELQLREAERIAWNRLEELRSETDTLETGWAIDDWRRLLAKVRLSLARTLAARGQSDQAVANADAARDAFEEFADPVRQVRAARLLAGIAVRKGNPGKARAGLEWAGKIARYYNLAGHAEQIARDLEDLDAEEG